MPASPSPQHDRFVVSRIKRLLTSNITASAIQQFSQILSGLGLQIYLARSFTKGEFGTIAFIGSVLAMIAFIVQMRVGPLIARNVARDPDSAPTWMARGQAVTLALAPLGFLLSALWVAAQDGRPMVIVATLVASLAMFFNGMMVIADAVLQGLSRLAPIGPAWIVGRMTQVVVTIAAVELGGSIISVYGGQAIGIAIVMSMLLYAVRRQVGSWPMRVPLPDMTSMMKEGIPFAGVQFFGSIYLLADVILLEYLRGQEEVAVYRVASLAVVHLPVLSFIVLRGLYPRMAALKDLRDKAGEELTFAIHVLLVLSLPLAVGGMLVAEPLVVAAIDDRYASAALPMLWLLPMVPLRFISNATGMTMNALDLPALRARGLAIAAVGNVALNLLLIPYYGAAAAAATTLAADIFLVGFQVWAVRRVASSVDYLSPIVKVLPALVAMTSVVLATSSLHVFIRVGLGGAAYAAVVLGMRLVTRSDLTRLVKT